MNARILVVDDDPAIAEMIGIILRGEGYEPLFAADGTGFPRRGLPPAHLDSGYRRYRVLRELPVWRAVSAPWFGQPGGGVRYRTMYSAAELVALGYLADITFEERA